MEYIDGKITEHFNLYEFRSRDNNTMLVNSATVDHIRRLEKFRVWYGRPMQIDSGYRSPAFNATVGGAEASQHLQGIASDIPMPLEFKDFTKERKAEFMDNAKNRWIAICGADGLGGGFGYYDTFMHLDSRQIQSIFDYRTVPKIEVKTNGIIKYVEVDPLSLKYIDLSKSPKLVTVLTKTYKNFANGPLFFPGIRPIFLVVQNGVKLYDVKSFDLNAKGTLIIYDSGRVEIKTLHTIADVSNIKLAFQGFNLNYEANGSTTLNKSIIKEGYLTDVYRECNRIGFGYNGKMIIANVFGTAEVLRKSIRTLGCIFNGDTYGIGLDSGSRNAFVINGQIVSDGLAAQEHIVTF